MRKNRAVIILLTVVSYLIFILVAIVLGVINESSFSENDTVNKSENVIETYSIKKSTISVNINIKRVSGMDPTPNPPLPPDTEYDNELETID